MTGAVARASASFPDEPESARAARRFTTAFLREHGLEAYRDEAELAVSELTTNALLHAGGPFHVGLCTDGRGVRVQVTDASPALPQQREAGTQATTGRGLSLLDAVASEHGVRPLARGKTVWFVLGEAPEGVDVVPSAPAPEDDADDAPVPVRLPGFPADLWAAARPHHDALLRELVLHLAQHPDPQTSEQLVRCGAARAQVAGAVLGRLTDQDLLARAAGDRSAPLHLDVDLALRRRDSTGFSALQDVLDVAELLAREGRLLAPPALPEVVALRDWVCEQVIAQLSGVPAAPWPGAGLPAFLAEPEAPGRSPGWDPDALAGSELGVAAADESGRLVAVSRPLAEALGSAVEDLVGRRVVALIPPELREAHVAGFTRHTTTGASRVVGVPLRLPVLKADGSTVTCDVLLERTPATTGRPLFVAWIAPAPDA